VPARKSPTPFNDDDFVYFELKSPRFRAFDHYNEEATYAVPDFEPGIYRVLIDAIRPATARDRKQRPGELISVDSAQIFFVDEAYAEKFRKLLDLEQGGWPNYPYFEKLRKKVGVDFGHASLTSDDVYVLDISSLERIDLAKTLKYRKAPPKGDLYLKVAKRMRTFICEPCFEEELMADKETDEQLAQLAKEQGWLLVPCDEGQTGEFFEGFRVIGPKCAAKR
jgi:hypothetical protein